MKAVVISSFGGPEVLEIQERENPAPGPDDVVVRIRATAVNRADVLQRRGYYPPPPSAPQDIPGLEFAGEVEIVGSNVANWKIGDRVFGLAAGGTYAELLSTHSQTIARIPYNLSFTEAAAVPEAFVTAYDAAVVQAGLGEGQVLLITAVGSGVGTAAVQIARVKMATSIGTARQQTKLDSAKTLGLTHGILTSTPDYAAHVLKLTADAGADVVLELAGGAYVAEDIKCAANKGRIVVVGLVAGSKVETDLGLLLRKRLKMIGTTLRMRPLSEKIIAAILLQDELAPLFASGELKPIIDKVFPLSNAADAHAYMEANENFGKIVLAVPQ